MDRRDEELQALAEQVVDSLKRLPQDGQERQVTISIGGNNHGSIHTGPVVNINPASPREPELHERNSQELLTIRRGFITEANAAKWRRYLNVPCISMICLGLAALLFALWNAYMLFNYGVSSTLLVLNAKSMMIFISWGVAVTLCGKAMDKIRKIENRIIDENQYTIDSIDTILRRRST